MKKFTLSAILLLLCVLGAGAYNLHEESMTYKVMFKWGLINKQAGTVTIETRKDGNDYYSSELIGRSAGWADPFFSVRDTLRATINKSTLEPVFYEKIAREGGDYKHDVIRYTRNGEKVTGKCTRDRQRKKERSVTKIDTTLQATGMTLDILSAFYYMRHLDYSRMKAGEAATATIFSGQRKETLRITYHGTERVQLDNKHILCYYITFTFTGSNGKKSSDDMYAWISVDSARIPLKMKGNLPVGSVNCYYVGEKTR